LPTHFLYKNWDVYLYKKMKSWLINKRYLKDDIYVENNKVPYGNIYKKFNWKLLLDNYDIIFDTDSLIWRNDIPFIGLLRIEKNNFTAYEILRKCKTVPFNIIVENINFNWDLTDRPDILKIIYRYLGTDTDNKFINKNILFKLVNKMSNWDIIIQFPNIQWDTSLLRDVPYDKISNHIILNKLLLTDDKAPWYLILPMILKYSDNQIVNTLSKRTDIPYENFMKYDDVRLDIVLSSNAPCDLMLDNLHLNWVKTDNIPVDLLINKFYSEHIHSEKILSLLNSHKNVPQKFIYDNYDYAWNDFHFENMDLEYLELFSKKHSVNKIENAPLEILEKYKDLDWNWYKLLPKFPFETALSFVEKYLHKYEYLIYHEHIGMKYIRKITDRITVGYCAKYKKMIKISKKYNNIIIDWESMSRNIDIKFIDKNIYNYNWNWNAISSNKTITLKFIKKYEKYLVFENMSV